MRAAGNYAVYFAAAGWLLFFAGYLVSAPWWRSAVGRNMMLLAALIVGTLALSTCTLAFGTTWPARYFIRFVIFGVLGITGWGQALILLRRQILKRRGELHEETDGDADQGTVERVGRADERAGAS